jgi:hypothetical protein
MAYFGSAHCRIDCWASINAIGVRWNGKQSAIRRDSQSKARQSVGDRIKRSEETIVPRARFGAAARFNGMAQSSGDAPWCAGLEATICSHWIYHLLRPCAAELKMAHPARLRAITAAKRNTDCLDALMSVDLCAVTCFQSVTSCHRLMNKQLLYRSLIVRNRVKFKNKTAGLLIDNDEPYETRKLQEEYLAALLEDSEGMTEQLQRLLRFNRSQLKNGRAY